MKKLLSLAVVIVMAVSITACAANKDYIGVDRAKSIAFANAGVEENEVQNLDVELDRDRGTEVYDINFDIDGYEYEYEVDAVSGEIFRSHRELEDAARLPEATVSDDTLNEEPVTESEPAATEPAVENVPDAAPEPEVTSAPETTAAPETAPAPATTPAPVTTPAPAQNPAPAAAPAQNNSGDYISMEAAKKAALDHAGLKESDVWEVSVELDRERGVTVYDVGFDTEGYDYDYEIDAYTGEVLRSDKERDNNVRPANKVDSSGFISADSARDIALQHAGISLSDAREVDVELDKYLGTDSYEVSFKSGGYEYDYDINASTGEILNNKKERDD